MDKFDSMQAIAKGADQLSGDRSAERRQESLALDELRSARTAMESAMGRLSGPPAAAISEQIRSLHLLLEQLESSRQGVASPQAPSTGSEQQRAAQNVEAGPAAPSIPKEFQNLVPAFCESGEGAKLFQELVAESIKDPTSYAATAVAYLDVIKSSPIGAKVPRQFLDAVSNFSRMLVFSARSGGLPETAIQKKLESWATAMNGWFGSDERFQASKVDIAIRVPQLGDARETWMPALGKGVPVDKINAWAVRQGVSTAVQAEVNLNLQPQRQKNEVHEGDVTAETLAVPDVCKSGNGKVFFDELTAYADTHPQSFAATAKAYLHLINSFPKKLALGDASKFADAMAELSRQLIQQERSAGLNEDAIASKLYKWGDDLWKSGEKRVSLSVPIVGGGVDMNTMAYPSGPDIRTIRSWAVRNEAGAVVRKAEVNWRE